MDRCSVYSITGGGSKKDDAEKKEDVLNIFSVASGHLYERFLRWVSFFFRPCDRGCCPHCPAPKFQSTAPAPLFAATKDKDPQMIYVGDGQGGLFYFNFLNLISE